MSALIIKVKDMKKIRNEETDVLFEAMLSLKSIDECKNFFDDLCTHKEISDMSQRLLVAKLLQQGVKYLEISERTGASSATISRVARCLLDQNSGYIKVLNKGVNDDAESV